MTAPAPTATGRSSALELAAAIRGGARSAVDVVDEALRLVDAWNPGLNAIVVDLRDEAREAAAAADRLLAAADPDDAPPPLLGVPITIKESICVAGAPNSAGALPRRDVRAAEDAPVVARLRAAGAIPIGLTNTSELCMWIETDNPVHGLTRNPYDPARSAGGSSGGEGAAVGAGIVSFGIGSDVGGSIRIPAAWNGVFGHKPSLGLVPLTGAFPPAVGETGRLLVNGPLSRRADDLMPVLRTIAGPDGSCERAVPMDLGDPAGVGLDGLRVLVGDRPFLGRTAAEVLAARDRAAATLQAAGARIVPADLRGWRRAYEAYLVALADGGALTMMDELEAAGYARPTVRTLLRGSPHTAATRLLTLGDLVPSGSSRRRAKLIEAGRAFSREVAAQIGDGVLLVPPMPTTAPPHGATLRRPWIGHGMQVLNLAAVPVTQVPMGLGAGGLPVGVQVAAGPGRDHVSIAVALELERAHGGWVPPGG
ncbi:amidase [Patulibacter sp.]|uniref:amidase n=1 Tax=Patulibacter sp. TaxID=1912859 RepID=UPI00272802F0|nr:amidase [Patulibacter sp.]MDO9410037.1 amidase [Patulibacter sp.]